MINNHIHLNVNTYYNVTTNNENDNIKINTSLNNPDNMILAIIENTKKNIMVLATKENIQIKY